MDIRRLDLLRELAERGSVTAVAEAEGVTPSAVSQQLKVLEREAGVPLTERSGRGLALTSAGQALARSAADVAVAVEHAMALWDRYRNHPSGEVSVLTFPTFGAAVLPDVVTELADVGGLVVNAEDLDPELGDFAPLTSDYDIVLAHAPVGELPWGGRGLRVTPLMTEPLDVGLPPGHPLASKATLSPADVVDEPWLGVQQGAPFSRLLHAIEQQTGRRTRVVQHFNDMRIIEAFIQAGHGIAFVPRYTSPVPEGVVLKPLRGVQAARSIVALSRPDVAERLAVATVLDVLVARTARLEADHHAATGPATSAILLPQQPPA